MPLVEMRLYQRSDTDEHPAEVPTTMILLLMMSRRMTAAMT
jgi:hypothetical protein